MTKKDKKQSGKRPSLEKMLKLSDQMASQHAYLRDLFGKKALLADILLVILAGLLSALTFTGEEFWTYVGINILTSKVILGGLSVSVFILTLIVWKVAWKSKNSAHNEALKVYSNFKLKIQHQAKQKKLNENKLGNLEKEYRALGQFTISIPEKDFLKSKKHHKQKIKISKVIDEHPSTSIMLLKAKFWWEDNFGNK